MRLRLTKQQRAFQEEVIDTYGLLLIFKPSARLAEEMAKYIHELEKDLLLERHKSPWTRIKEWWRR